MKILVCGGRHYSDTATVFKVLDALDPGVVIHGGATGADSLATRWCGVQVHDKGRDTRCRVYPAYWSKHGHRAGPMRNAEMLRKHPDIAFVVAFPGGSGTADMKAKAHKAGITVLEVAEGR